MYISVKISRNFRFFRQVMDVQKSRDVGHLGLRVFNQQVKVYD